MIWVFLRQRSVTLQTIFFISIGAIVGANLRYWISIWAGQRWGAQFPAGTLIINLTGSLLLGFFITVVTERLLIDPHWRVFFAIGLLGSYTTFSTYTFESVALLMAGNWLLGLVNLLGSALLGAVAVIAGILVGRLF